MDTPLPARFLQDMMKANALKRSGWRPAGTGNGPLGEAEWWSPIELDMPQLTYPFEEAVRLNDATAA